MAPWVESDDFSKPFFDGARRGWFMLRYCNDCAGWSWPGIIAAPGVRTRCPHCLSGRVVWRRSAGHGVIYTFTRIRSKSDPSSGAPTLALVELEEGPRFLSRVRRADHAVYIGMEVTVAFDQEEPNPIPYVRPSDR